MTERQVRFEALYAANHAPILGYALRRTDSPDDAADILAETFLAAWRRLDDVPAGDEARLWLYGVARRLLANHYRGERRRSALAGRLRTELASCYVSPEFDCESARIAGALRRLPERQRELLALNAWEGLDYGEIATVLGCSRNAVRIRLHRARASLAAELAGPAAEASGPGIAGPAAEASDSGPAGAVAQAFDPGLVGAAAQATDPGLAATAAARAPDPELTARPGQHRRG
jgi:RNA polymerase sigma-70 factor (ECF subfamily)